MKLLRKILVQNFEYAKWKCQRMLNFGKSSIIFRFHQTNTAQNSKQKRMERQWIFGKWPIVYPLESHILMFFSIVAAIFVVCRRCCSFSF